MIINCTLPPEAFVSRYLKSMNELQKQGLIAITTYYY